MEKIKIILKGGCFDGKEYFVDPGQKEIYIQHELTMAEWNELKIDEMKCWNPPMDVYNCIIWMDFDGIQTYEYLYHKTIHYKPKHITAYKLIGEWK